MGLALSGQRRQPTDVGANLCERQRSTAVAKVVNGDDALGGDQISTDTSKPVEFDLWASRAACAPIERTRIEDANQVEFAQIASIEVDITAPMGIRSVRVAESAARFFEHDQFHRQYVTPESISIPIATCLNPNPAP